MEFVGGFKMTNWSYFWGHDPFWRYPPFWTYLLIINLYSLSIGRVIIIDLMGKECLRLWCQMSWLLNPKIFLHLHSLAHNQWNALLFSIADHPQMISPISTLVHHILMCHLPNFAWEPFSFLLFLRFICLFHFWISLC